MTRDIKAIRANGGMTSTDVAELLKIGTTTLRRIEGTVFGPVNRSGGRKIRVFSKDDLARIRAWVASRRPSTCDAGRGQEEQGLKSDRGSCVR